MLRKIRLTLAVIIFTMTLFCSLTLRGERIAGWDG